MPFNQYGPNYNPNYMGNYQRGYNPINTPLNRIPPIKPPTRTATSKLTFSKFLNGTQQVIETVSSAIPLYTQVKPLFSGIRSVGKSITGKIFNKSSGKKEYIANPEIITPKKSVKKEEKYEEYNEETSPNRPFF